MPMNRKIGTISKKFFRPYEWIFSKSSPWPTYIIKEVTGNWYINLTNAVAHRLMELKAYGWTEQNWTPTPTTPVDIVCNNWVLKLSPNGKIYTDGTVETINIHGKNLFNKNSELTNGYINSSGAIVLSNSLRISLFIEIKPNTTYTISGAGDVRGLWYDRYAYTYTAEQTPIAQVSSRGASATFTTAQNAKYIRIQMTPDAVDTCQLERGSTATEYQPYYDGGTATAEMLLKVGDYQDEQEILSGNVTRNVGVKVLDGTENWTKSGARSGLFFSKSAFPGATFGIVLCTHLPYSTSLEKGYIYNSRGELNFWTDFDSFALNDWKQWLADQYAAGTPVIVVYPLATPTTESVARQTMNIPAWDSTIEITQASIENLPLYAKYKATA